MTPNATTPAARKETIQLEVHDRIDAIAAAEWDGLVARMREPAIYHSYDWARLWMQYFGGNIKPRILAVREGKQLIGLLPMALDTQRLKIFSRRRLAPLSSASPPAPQYLGPICDPEREEKTLEAMASFLSKSTDADALYFENFLPGQPVEKLIQNLESKNGRRVIRWSGETTYWVPLADEPDAFLSLLNRKLRKNIVSARNRFAATENARIEPVRDLAGVKTAVEAFRRHSIARLGEKGLHSTLNDDRMAGFFAELAKTCFERDRAIYFSAWLGETCIGTIFGLRIGSYICYYNGSFDPEFSNLSPGTLLIDALCRDAIARGHKKLDMLGGFGEYKHRWAGENCARLHLATVPLHRVNCIPFTFWEKWKSKKISPESAENPDLES